MSVDCAPAYLKLNVAPVTANPLGSGELVVASTYLVELNAVAQLPVASVIPSANASSADWFDSAAPAEASRRSQAEVVAV